MTNPLDLSELERLLTTTGGSDQLSAEVVCKLLAPGEWIVSALEWPVSLRPFRHCTTDLSAAVALCERRFPGWTIGLAIHPDMTAAIIQQGDLSRDSIHAPTPAAALCAAMLKTLEEQP